MDGLVFKLVGFGNKLRVVLDWSLDLFVERSSSQIYARRELLEVGASHQHDDPAKFADRTSEARAKAFDSTTQPNVVANQSS